MAGIDLTQAEADALFGMEKQRVDAYRWDFPSLGGQINIPLQSSDRREKFSLDLERSRIKLTKLTYQSRARGVVVLARLDLDGGPHRNPDGTSVPCPHLHQFREGFGDKWAEPAPLAVFTDPSDRWQVYDDFLDFCNVTLRPNLERDLLP